MKIFLSSSIFSFWTRYGPRIQVGPHPFPPQSMKGPSYLWLPSPVGITNTAVPPPRIICNRVMVFGDATPAADPHDAVQLFAAAVVLVPLLFPHPGWETEAGGQWPAKFPVLSSHLSCVRGRSGVAAGSPVVVWSRDVTKITESHNVDNVDNTATAFVLPGAMMATVIHSVDYVLVRSLRQTDEMDLGCAGGCKKSLENT